MNTDKSPSSSLEKNNIKGHKYNSRILIVDDNESIHEDFRKVLIHERSKEHVELDELEAELFGSDEEPTTAPKKTQEQPKYELDSAFQGEEALKMVKEAEEEGRTYALIFMDVRMPPGWDGIETISRIWVEHPYIEMVLCTAYSDYTWDDIVEKLGSNDKLLFLRKPFDAVAVQQMSLSLVKKWNLGEQARYYVRDLEDVVQQRTVQLKELLVELESKNDELANNNVQLKHRTLHDSLTNLPNRSLFHDRLEQAIKVAKRNKTTFAVALMDLNGFKEINDTLGHLAGDLLLQAIAQRTKDTLRSSDTVARLGGDEFAFLLLGHENQDPVLVAKKILSALSDVITIDGKDIVVGASIGMALFPDHGDDHDNLIGKADMSMYEAKRNGGGVHTFCLSEKKCDG